MLFVSFSAAIEKDDVKFPSLAEKRGWQLYKKLPIPKEEQNYQYFYSCTAFLRIIRKKVSDLGI